MLPWVLRLLFAWCCQPKAPLSMRLGHAMDASIVYYYSDPGVGRFPLVQFFVLLRGLSTVLTSTFGLDFNMILGHISST